MERALITKDEVDLELAFAAAAGGPPERARQARETLARWAGLPRERFEAGHLLQRVRDAVAPPGP